jgi:hypothetical protein
VGRHGLIGVPDVRADEDSHPLVLTLAQAVPVGPDGPLVALAEMDAFVARAFPGVQPDGLVGPVLRVPVVPAAAGVLAVLAVRGALPGVLAVRAVRAELIAPAALVGRHVEAVPDGPAVLDVPVALVFQPADWPDGGLPDAVGPPVRPVAAALLLTAWSSLRSGVAHGSRTQIELDWCWLPACVVLGL